MKFFMKVIKKNQIIVYVVVLILMVAGYLNYTSYTEKQVALETAMQMESKDGVELADIGDATLVNSNDVTSLEGNDIQDTQETKETKEAQENKVIQDVQEIKETQENQETKEVQATQEVKETASNSTDDYFVQSKLERESMYSQMLETYENVLNSEHSLETQRQSATQEIEKINKTKNAIMICENLIKTKGFENSIIFVNGESVNVIIRADELKQEEIAQIQNIVSREIQSKIEDIHITNK